MIERFEDIKSTLRLVPLFSDLNDKVLSHLAEVCQEKVYEKDQHILHQEQAGDNFFVIESGSVKVTRLAEDGREAVLAFLRDGDFFGELAILDGETRSANIITLSECKIQTINRREFLDLLEHHPSVATALLMELALRLRKTDMHLEYLTLSDAEGKIASILISLAEENGTYKMGDVTLGDMPMQQDIANMAGTTRETVSRMMKKLEEKNWLSRDGQKVIIRKYSKFKEIYQLKF
ncbi:MAG: Crp/Fnr family transcriptional regulator [Candidatus Marinimicrobia bacterium]|nr:Crp/Fnr family transcriptional regulator [Candidatus Neomarinimicrobiota bacterium]